MTNISDFFKAAAASAGMTGLRIMAIDNVPGLPGPQDQFRWAFEQGSLFCLVLVILWFYRRDFKRQRLVDGERFREYQERDQARFNLMLDALKGNTLGLADMRGTHARLARAVEGMNERRRANDPEDDADT